MRQSRQDEDVSDHVKRTRSIRDETSGSSRVVMATGAAKRYSPPSLLRARQIAFLLLSSFEIAIRPSFDAGAKAFGIPPAGLRPLLFTCACVYI